MISVWTWSYPSVSQVSPNSTQIHFPISTEFNRTISTCHWEREICYYCLHWWEDKVLSSLIHLVLLSRADQAANQPTSLSSSAWGPWPVTACAPAARPAGWRWERVLRTLSCDGGFEGFWAPKKWKARPVSIKGRERVGNWAKLKAHQ